jgi:hypothetical protein
MQMCVCREAGLAVPVCRGSIACMVAARLHTLSYYMQDACTGAYNTAPNGIAARMCLPRAASCDLQEHGIDPRHCSYDGVGLQLYADHVPLQPVQVRLPLQRARLLRQIDCWQS